MAYSNVTCVAEDAQCRPPKRTSLNELIEKQKAITCETANILADLLRTVGEPAFDVECGVSSGSCMGEQMALIVEKMDQNLHLLADLRDMIYTN